MDDQNKKNYKNLSEIKINWDAVRSFISDVETGKGDKLPGTPCFAEKNKAPKKNKNKKTKKKVNYNSNRFKKSSVLSSNLNPNAPNYESQLLKEQLKRKFGGYKYGLSDW